LALANHENSENQTDLASPLQTLLFLLVEVPPSLLMEYFGRLEEISCGAVSSFLDSLCPEQHVLLALVLWILLTDRIKEKTATSHASKTIQ
jgi:hypothetical protein